jgi:DNA invertase Pin-like site-specific DNA recombinase
MAIVITRVKLSQFVFLKKITDPKSLDTTKPASKAMFQMLGVFAEFERSMIQERVRAGLRRAKSEGKQLGRPRIAPSGRADQLSRKSCSLLPHS